MNRSTYRLQENRHPSNREVRRVLLADTITELHLASRSAYGHRRIRAALFYEHGLIVNRKLIRRVMAEQGLHGLPVQKKGRKNLVNVATSEDRVNRNFMAPSPNAIWLTDITEHKTPWVQPVVATPDHWEMLRWFPQRAESQESRTSNTRRPRGGSSFFDWTGADRFCRRRTWNQPAFGLSVASRSRRFNAACSQS
jgi:HTH-like domain